jgi:hypothetical protein
LNAADRVIRLGSCQRSAAELVRDLPVFCGYIERFLRQFPEYAAWQVERVSLAPHVLQDVRTFGKKSRSERPEGWAVRVYSECRQVGFAAPPVVQRKLAFEQAASLAVKTAGQRGHGLMHERAEIGRMLQRPADNAVSQVARRFAAWGHG